jgi:hypothetical protein
MEMDRNMATIKRKINKIEIHKMAAGNKAVFLNIMDSSSAFI